MITTVEVMDGDVKVKHSWKANDVFDHEATYDCPCGPTPFTRRSIFVPDPEVEVLHPALLLDG